MSDSVLIFPFQRFIYFIYTNMRSVWRHKPTKKIAWLFLFFFLPSAENQLWSTFCLFLCCYIQNNSRKPRKQRYINNNRATKKKRLWKECMHCKYRDDLNAVSSRNNRMYCNRMEQHHTSHYTTHSPFKRKKMAIFWRQFDHILYSIIMRTTRWKECVNCWKTKFQENVKNSSQMVYYSSIT